MSFVEQKEDENHPLVFVVVERMSESRVKVVCIPNNPLPTKKHFLFLSCNMQLLIMRRMSDLQIAMRGVTVGLGLLRITT